MSWFRSKEKPAPAPVPEPAPEAVSDGIHVSVDDEDDKPTNVGARPKPSGDGVSRIAADTVIKGSVTTASPLVLAGVVEGGVQSSSDVSVLADAQVQGSVAGGHVDVQKGGAVDGGVAARDVENAGEIKGDVNATGRLVIRSSGGVRGNVSVGSLIVEEGGSLKGGCRMGKS